MKKLFTKLLAGMMALGCVCAMAACSPKLDMRGVEDALEDNDYVVEILKGDEATFMGVQGVVSKVLYAENEETGEYFYMYEAQDEEAAELYYAMKKTEIKNEIAQCKDQIALYKNLKNNYEKDLMHEDLADIEDEIKGLKKEIEDLEEDLKCIGVNGVYFWEASSEEALKDAQK